MSHIPNMLTILRILLIPVFVLLFVEGIYTMAIITFIISVSTDFFDGYLAKKYNLTSDLGRVLDPLADKLTIISILIVLIFTGIIPGIIAGIFLFRELFILLGGLLAYLMQVDIIRATKLGKVAIFLLYLAIISALFNKMLDIKYINMEYVSMIIFYIAIPLNVVSGIDYVIKAVKHNTKSFD
ncbi:MAG: CDP-diacylglycerol--glycerol-3-phosphate 3-phosphatidyltransferase [bacterium]